MTWLSRFSDWNGTLPTRETVKLALTESCSRRTWKDPLRSLPTTRALICPPWAPRTALLYDMIGLDYNDPKWDELLDQMTFDEMNSLIGDAFHWTMPVGD